MLMCSCCRNVSRQASEAACKDTAAGVAGRICLLLLKGYQYCISPLFPPCCRFTPTCSEYAVQAVSRYGAIRGMWLAVCRVLRCHPFARGGYDPLQ